ncbi:peptidoglycan DD-metalloendopeptidase family protein [Saccharothrix tamanrassetensis]|uniref:peptidoglycan DD-metalloendopeptidase family protein n=1 Tax=Saccharothrix tamanrassetensis TaxID=1051531 RepID=UPI0035E40EB4
MPQKPGPPPPPTTLRLRPRPTLLVLTTAALLASLVTPLPAAFPAAARPLRYAWPLAPPHPVLRTFHAPSTPFGPGHRGVDLGSPPAARVLAAGDATVVFAGPVGTRQLVSLSHQGGLRTTYEPLKPLVARGQRVARGTPIGTLQPGHEGCRTTCLHWGAFRLKAQPSPPQPQLSTSPPSTSPSSAPQPGAPQPNAPQSSPPQPNVTLEPDGIPQPGREYFDPLTLLARGQVRLLPLSPTAPRPATSRPTAPEPTASRPTASRPTAPRRTAPKPHASRPDAPRPAAPGARPAARASASPVRLRAAR